MADGTENDDSDIDLLVIQNSLLPRHKRGREIQRHLTGIKEPVDIVVYTPDEIDLENKIRHSFINKTLQTGILMYERKK
jgi:uncharacterized protein